MKFLKLAGALTLISAFCIPPPCYAADETIGWTADRLTLDGRPFFIKAVSYSVSYPGKKVFSEISFSVFEADFRKIKESGFNTIRTYESLPEPLLDLAEKEGLKVIEGVVRIDGQTNFSSAAELEKISTEAARIVRRDKARRCILMWSAWNDAPFHWDKEGNIIPRYGFRQSGDFLRKIYERIKAEDPSRPVTASNALNAPGYQLGLDFIDVIGINVYIGVSDWSSGAFDRELGITTVRRLQRLSKDYGKPVYVSEMGLSSFCAASSQKDVLPEQIAIVGEKLAGFTLFQWQDEWTKTGDADRQSSDIEAHWGLVDAHRKPKEGLVPLSGILKEIDDASYGYAGTLPAVVDTAQNTAPLETNRLALIEDFEYESNRDLLHAFKSNWKSRAQAALTVDEKDSASGACSLKITFSPQDTGAWALWHRYFEATLDLSKAKTLSFRMKSDGPPLNVSLMLIDKDGERYRGTPVLTQSGPWRAYTLELAKMYRDSYDSLYEGANPSADSKPGWTSLRGFSLKLNDVPNAEDLFHASSVHIDTVEAGS
jgi:hypothetical protein